jgi:hypothetical protein
MRTLNLKFSVCVGHSATVLTVLEHHRKRWLKSHPRVCFAGVLCIDSFLQLCSGLEHNHQEVAADATSPGVGRQFQAASKVT